MVDGGSGSWDRSWDHHWSVLPGLSLGIATNWPGFQRLGDPAVDEPPIVGRKRHLFIYLVVVTHPKKIANQPTNPIHGGICEMFKTTSQLFIMGWWFINMAVPSWSTQLEWASQAIRSDMTGAMANNQLFWWSRTYVTWPSFPHMPMLKTVLKLM